MKSVDLTTIARRLLELHQISAANKDQAKRLSSRKLRRPRQRPVLGLSTSQLYIRTLPSRIRNARRDYVTAVSVRHRGQRLISTTLTYDETFRPPQVRAHKQWIWRAEGVDPEIPFYQCPRILCSCDCDDWKYSFEYALTHHGASVIRFSNGEFPIIKNPSLRVSLCKHLFVIFGFILRMKI